MARPPVSGRVHYPFRRHGPFHGRAACPGPFWDDRFATRMTTIVVEKTASEQPTRRLKNKNVQNGRKSFAAAVVPAGGGGGGAQNETRRPDVFGTYESVKSI